MAKCPIILLKRKSEEGYYFKTSDKLEEIFEKGSHIHILEGIYRNGAKGLIDVELHMSMIDNSGEFIFSGYSDFIMIHDNGIYIEDLKTCDLKAFYHFYSEKGSWGERVQLSCYKLLYYIVFGAEIKHGVITKIDRDNILNRISLEVDLMSLEQTETFIIDHPSVSLLLGKIDEEEFMTRTEIIILQNRWLCSYCSDKKECELNSKLTKQEREQKKKDKKQKEIFEKLIKE